MKVLFSLLVLVAFATPFALAQPDATLLPKGFSGEFVELDDVRLHYVTGGEGEPLVLLHGWGST